jgi:protease IV
LQYIKYKSKILLNGDCCKIPKKFLATNSGISKQSQLKERSKLKKFLIFVFYAFLLSLIFANTVFAKSLLYQSLKDGIGVRALSMGNAYTAVARGTSAGYYNPGGLVVPGSMYKYENMDYKGAVYNSYTYNSLYLSPMEISNWKMEDINGDLVEVSSYAFGRRGKKGIDWGINYKSVTETYGGAKSSGWSMDLGLLLHLTQNINIGINAKDIVKENVAIPSTLHTGLSFMPINESFILSTDFVFIKGKDKVNVNNHLGFEGCIAEGLILRGGFYDNNLTGGFKIVLPFIKLEYGFIYNMLDNRENINMVSFGLGKGLMKPRKKRRYSFFKPKSFAEFKINNNLVEGKSDISLFGGHKIGSNDLLSLIHQANKDETCEGFIMKIGSISSSLSSIGLIQEIRQEIMKGKKKGKRVIAYIENWATLPEYYLASIADKIIMPELGTISHLGINLEILKTKNFLNNWGINPLIITSGKYKGTLSPNTDKLSEEKEVVLEELVNSLYHQVLFDIKENRKLDWDKVSKIFDGRLITASEALELGLIDSLGYWDKVKEIANADKKQKDPSIINIQNFADIPEATSIFSPFNKIAVIEVDGAITSGKEKNDFLFGGKKTGADDINKIVEKINKDITVKGVILRVNSPGGGLLASDKIYTAIEKLKKSGKTVYTSMGNLAASGGYYISMNSDKIIANPGSLTGSIGVISSFFSLENLNDILGIDYQSIKTGKYMDMFSSNKNLNKEEIDMYQKYQDNHKKAFVDKLKENRDLSDEEANEIAQGQVLTGKQAHKLKIVDDLGNFYDAVDSLAKKVNINDPELVFYREKNLLPMLSSNIFTQLFQ